MRSRCVVIMSLSVLLLSSWLVAGCSPAPSAEAGSKALVGTPSATVRQAKQEPARTPSATRYYDVPLPPATATALALQSPAPADGLKLTILHTNDSRGYVDPCG